MTPLHGLKVLELARVLAGPWAGQVLADLGADVVKVEGPEGDETRNWGPPFAPDGAAAYYHSTNRGKRDVTADFRNADDLAMVKALAAEADVIIENFKVGGLAKFGLDYASLAPSNPGLVYCSITGFGQTGPYAPRAGYDFIIQAMGGIMDLTGEPDGEPQKPGMAYSDLMTGLYGVIGIQAALAQRAITGKGQHIDMSLFDTQLAVLPNQTNNYLTSGKVPRRMGNAHPNIVPYQVFYASDAPFVIACGNDHQFEHLCQKLNLTLHTDPRFSKNTNRVTHREALIPLLADEMAKHTRTEMLALMEAAGVPAGPINTVAEALADPQAQSRAMVQDHGQTRSVRLPIKFSDSTLPTPTAAPLKDADGPAIRTAAAQHRWPTKD
jgi:crotonobetainyl-CoA:carnitine CoA-transferase CaiB-like acyl-CoA transferase